MFSDSDRAEFGLDSKRALRRHHRHRMIEYARSSQRYSRMGPSDREYQSVRRHDYLATCSCWMCGNPRKYMGERTLQEQRIAALPLRGGCGRVEELD